MAQTARIDVPRTILDWVISIGAEDHLSENQRQNIDAWKLGTKRPTVSQLHKVSDQLRVPFGYFFMDEPFDDTPISTLNALLTVSSYKVILPEILWTPSIR